MSNNVHNDVKYYKCLALMLHMAVRQLIVVTLQPFCIVTLSSYMQTVEIFAVN